MKSSMTAASNLKSNDTAAKQREETLARIDLAAAFRLAVRNNFHEGIDNHFTLTVPENQKHFFLNPYGLHWSEIKASDLLEVDHNGAVVRGTGIAEKSAVCIHGPIHRLVPGATCVLHTHMPYATALSQLEVMTLEMTGQNAVSFFGDVAYDYEYRGLAFNKAEGERMAALMGSRPILMLANHGVIVCGTSVAEAFNRLYFFERACRTQILSMATGMPRRQISADIIAKTKAQFDSDNTMGGIPMHEHHFSALKRILDQQEPDYKC